MRFTHITLLGAALTTSAVAIAVPLAAKSIDASASAQGESTEGLAPVGGAAARAGASGQRAETPSKAQAARSLSSARDELAAAEERLAQLRAKGDALRAQEKSQRREVGGLARDVYAGGGTDLLTMSVLISGEDPRLALRDAGRAEEFLSAQSDQWRATTAAIEDNDQSVARADAAVKAADEKVARAQRAMIEAQGATAASGPGPERLARRCAETKSVSPVCIAPPWSEKHLTMDATLVTRYVSARWPQVKQMYGWRPSDPYPDHPSGRGTDLMMPNGGTGTDVALGNAIAKYFMDHAEEYGVYYILWRKRMWLSSNKPGDWSAMSDRGSSTANHMDHVHVSVKDGHSATVLKELLASADLPK